MKRWRPSQPRCGAFISASYDGFYPDQPLPMTLGLTHKFILAACCAVSQRQQVLYPVQTWLGDYPGSK